jgi:hypothetical protein
MGANDLIYDPSQPVPVIYMSLVKPKRMTVMKWHGYLSVFFLILMLLYSLTGTLYLFEITGNKTSRSVSLALDNWPASEKEALAIMPDILQKIGEEKLPKIYSDSKGHEWSALNKSILLTEDSENNSVLVTVSDSDFMRQMLMIHKGHGGPLFTVLGVALGIYLLVMIITGVWLSIKTKPMLRGSKISAFVGFSSVIIVYLITIY